jgi:hypothetical protein
MVKPEMSVMEKGIERILELSADAHVRRRGTFTGSPEFHNLTGAIAAFGKTLELLTTLQQWEEFYAMITESELPDSTAPC